MFLLIRMIRFCRGTVMFGSTFRALKRTEVVTLRLQTTCTGERLGPFLFSFLANTLEIWGMMTEPSNTS